MTQGGHESGESVVERRGVGGTGLAPEPHDHVVGQALLSLRQRPVLYHLGEGECGS